MPEWLAVLAPILGGFGAAWFGAKLAFRKTLRERALAGRVEWYEDAIRSLANCEEVLGRLRQNYLHVAVIRKVGSASTKPSTSNAKAEKPPARVFRPEPDRWKELVEAEARVRAALQLHDIYTSGRTAITCSVTLRSTATLAAGQWIDLGPAPQIAGDDLMARQFSLGGTRRVLQDELRRILQYDGWLRSTFPKLHKRLLLRELERQRREFEIAAARAGSTTVPPTGDRSEMVVGAATPPHVG